MVGLPKMRIDVGEVGVDIGVNIRMASVVSKDSIVVRIDSLHIQIFQLMDALRGTTAVGTTPSIGWGTARTTTIVRLKCIHHSAGAVVVL